VDVLDAEEELHEIARRRIHAARDIEEGETITEEDIEVLRSGKHKKGLEPKFYEEVLGRRAKTEIEEGEGVTGEDVSGQ
jgi:sialic acid synthase SpsE